MGRSLKLSRYGHADLLPRFENHADYLLDDPTVTLGGEVRYFPVSISAQEAHVFVRVKSWKVSITCNSYTATTVLVIQPPFGGDPVTTTVVTIYDAVDYVDVIPSTLAVEGGGMQQARNFCTPYADNSGNTRRAGDPGDYSDYHSYAGSAINQGGWGAITTHTCNVSTTVTSSDGTPPTSTSSTVQGGLSNGYTAFSGTQIGRNLGGGAVYRIADDETIYFGQVDFGTGAGGAVEFGNVYTDQSGTITLTSALGSVTLRLPSLPRVGANSTRDITLGAYVTDVTAVPIPPAGFVSAEFSYSPRDLVIVIEPNEYWPYADSQGRVVWDSSTGDPTHDPFG